MEFGRRRVRGEKSNSAPFEKRNTKGCATQLAPHRREDGPPEGLREYGAEVSASGGKVLFLFGAGGAF